MSQFPHRPLHLVIRISEARYGYFKAWIRFNIFVKTKTVCITKGVNWLNSWSSWDVEYATYHLCLVLYGFWVTSVGISTQVELTPQGYTEHHWMGWECSAKWIFMPQAFYWRVRFHHLRYKFVWISNFSKFGLYQGD